MAVGEPTTINRLSVCRFLFLACLWFHSTRQLYIEWCKNTIEEILGNLTKIVACFQTNRKHQWEISTFHKLCKSKGVGEWSELIIRQIPYLFIIYEQTLIRYIHQLKVKKYQILKTIDLKWIFNLWNFLSLNPIPHGVNAT